MGKVIIYIFYLLIKYLNMFILILYFKSLDLLLSI